MREMTTSNTRCDVDGTRSACLVDYRRHRRISVVVDWWRCQQQQQPLMARPLFMPWRCSGCGQWPPPLARRTTPIGQGRHQSALPAAAAAATAGVKINTSPHRRIAISWLHSHGIGATDVTSIKLVETAFRFHRVSRKKSHQLTSFEPARTARNAANTA